VGYDNTDGFRSVRPGGKNDLHSCAERWGRACTDRRRHRTRGRTNREPTIDQLDAPSSPPPRGADLVAESALEAPARMAMAQAQRYSSQRRFLT
jgi:hypothetical protein